MDKHELERRTKKFAVSVILFVEELPKKKTSDVLGYQLLKSGTSVGANYREANRAQSRADFVHKIGIVEKEIAETQYWLEVMEEVSLGDREARTTLLKEASELLSIFIAIGKSTRRNKPKLVANPKSAIRNSQSEIPMENPKSEIRNSS
jgi:four helix bundle protein